jgi:hypothetical protein
MMFLRMLICLAPVLAFGASTARAERFAPFNRTGSPAYTPVCAKTSGGATEPNAGASTKIRLAGACRCCGWENWEGHKVCVHQCCD